MGHCHFRSHWKYLQCESRHMSNILKVNKNIWWNSKKRPNRLPRVHKECCIWECVILNYPKLRCTCLEIQDTKLTLIYSHTNHKIHTGVWRFGSKSAHIREKMYRKLVTVVKLKRYSKVRLILWKYSDFLSCQCDTVWMLTQAQNEWNIRLCRITIVFQWEQLSGNFRKVTPQ